MKCTKLLLMAGALLFLGAGAVKAAELTIYSDDFSGSATDPLDGTAPGIRPGSETWTADTVFKADGSASVAGTSASLPFTPESGRIYTLSVDVAQPSGGRFLQWAGIAFGNSALPANTTIVGPWRTAAALIYRENGAASSYYGGDGTAASNNGVTSLNGNSGTQTLKMVLDTTAANWKVDYFIGAKSVGSHTFDGYPGDGTGSPTADTQPIDRVALGLGGSGTTFDNFTLTTIPEPAAQDLSFAVSSTHEAREIHVAVTGNDTHDGSSAAPLATVSAAAALAQPGDVVTVHERERYQSGKGTSL